MAQYNSQLTDGRQNDQACIGRALQIDGRPREALFGIQVHEDGDVYFEMNNEGWFNNIFSAGMGITADIVSRDRYNCNNMQAGSGSQLGSGPQAGAELFRGYVLPPLRFQDFRSRMVPTTAGSVLLKIGTLPATLRKKDVEGNLVILVGNKVCYYTYFVDIERSVWDLLPMGLYTDTLLNHVNLTDSGVVLPFYYERVAQVAVSFARNKASYSGEAIRKLYDSLQLNNCVIKEVDIRAYSSVEGPETVNNELMAARGRAMASALQKLQPGLDRIHILTAENWLDFYRQIKGSPDEALSRLTRPEVKARLVDKSLAERLEPILSQERKAILILYYGKRSGFEETTRDALLGGFAKAVKEKQIEQARRIEKEIAERVADNRLPDSYLDKLEIPREKAYWALLNDRLVYKYQLGLADWEVALREFRQLIQLDPKNGRMQYNICALSLVAWHYGDSANAKGLSAAIGKLPAAGIDTSLVRRMMVNYHILRSFDLLNQFEYSEKDRSVQFIKDAYERLPLTDEDRFSLAKFFEYYSQGEWAEEVIAGRIDQLDVSEDLVFYYVNLGFYSPERWREEKFTRALINAFTLDRERFCRFFRPMNKGGAGMQLLEFEQLRQLYCEKCSQRL